MSNITIFKNIRTTSTGFDKPIEYILNRIKNGNSKNAIEILRAEKDENKAKILKSNLPSICFSGTFRNRSKAGLKQHSGFICLDFDKFPNDEELTAYRDFIINDKYTYSCFISPSGNGLKVIVKIPADVNDHKQHFDSLKDYYKSDYFDISCSDVSRVCFESYDENIYINTESHIYFNKVEKSIYEIGTTTPKIAVTSQNRIISNLLQWFDKSYSMTKGNRNANLFKLAMAFNDFGIQKLEAESTLQRFQQSDFDSREINSIIDSAYRHFQNHNTKFFEDEFAKTKIENYIRQGKSQSEIQKEFGKENISDKINNVKEDLTVLDFWTYDKKGAISLVHHKYKKFLEERQFCKFTPEGVDNFIFVKINENLVEDTNATAIKDFVLQYLQSREDIGFKPFDFMANSTKYFKDDYLNFIDSAEIKLKEDTIDKCYLYFRNCAVEISKDKINLIDYIDLDGFVWKKQIIDRDFKHGTYENSVYQKFLMKIADNDETRYNSLISIIGYLMHSFKTSANNKAIILNDETISENPNGGSGKGIFCNALGHIKKMSSIDGKQFSFEKSFAYQTVSPDTQLLLFDDVKKNFAFENLFSLITEGITIEKKNKDALKIPVSKSPKILITTNYTIGGVGGSFERRKHEVEFSSYFNSKHTPLDEFNHMLFDDWNSHEWSKFDNFMVNCVQYYFTNGLIKHDFKNLDVRKFIKETSFEFYEWSEDGNLPTNIRLYKANKFEEFTKEYTDFYKLSKKRFSTWLESYSKFKGFIFEKGKSQDGHWIYFNETGTPIEKEIEVLTDDIPF